LASFQHPASLNEYQRYSQACSILRSTSRARNKAWFQEALDLDFQVHLRSEGGGLVSRIYNRKTSEWSEGSPITTDIFRDGEKAVVFANQLIDLAKQARANALGVILYIADEFATAELRSEFDNPGDLAELRGTAETNPAAIFEGASVSSDSQSFRVLPYPAAGGDAIATAISLSRQHAAFFDRLRETGEEQNFPVIAHALSAPLIALMALPEGAKPAKNKPFLAVLYYSPFTVMGFFNEHGDLRLLRTIQHRGQRRPMNLRDIATTTLAALEFSDPDVFILPLTRQADPSVMVDLQNTFPHARVDTVDWTQTPFSHRSIPAYCPELLIATRGADPTATSFSQTFEMFAGEKWVYQNFLPIPPEVAEIYPSRSEVQLLRTIRLARVALIALALLTVGWASMDVWGKVRQSAWKFQPEQAVSVQKRAGALTTERQQIEHWDNLLDDRSKAWASMELLCRLFPENSGLLVKGFGHTVRPEPAPGKPKVGFVKEWRISGYARDEALERLNLINSREGITALFSEVARDTGNEAFRTDIGNRSVLVNVRQQENNSFKRRPAEDMQASDTTTYPFAFDLTITQRFEATDPLALNATKAP
jgi:hypothetical protein